MTRLGIGVLDYLDDLGINSAIKAKTIYELLSDDSIARKFSQSNLYRTLQMLLVSGYVRYGLKSGRADTYFITEKGINYLNDIIKEV